MVLLGQSIVANMGLKRAALPTKLLQQLAVNARGSMCDYLNDVVIEAIRCCGVVPLQPSTALRSAFSALIEQQRDDGENSGP